MKLIANSHMKTFIWSSPFSDWY